jgi:phosphoadenosine phosphosulfate reductase
MAAFDGWASGVRRDQTPERAATPIVEARPHDGRVVVKVSPLARWSAADIATYLEVNGLPRHPLVEDGYASIGCAPCTVRVGPGQGPRAGRWARFDDKSECGIHLDGDDPTTTAG